MKRYQALVGLAVVFTFFWVDTALAARKARVVADQAAVVQYPKPNANILTRIDKGIEVNVSDRPTQGFYKVRAPDGRIGWISGNDIFVPPNESVPLEPYGKIREKREKSATLKEHSRLAIALGVQNLSFSGLPPAFDSTAMNPGTNLLVEMQFGISDYFYWALRGEVLRASTGERGLGNGVTEQLSLFSIPVQLGIDFSLIRANRFLLGLGLYAGLTYANFTIAQTTATQGTEATYTSFDPTGTLALHANIGISRRLGIYLEAAYRYEQSGDFNSTTSFGGVPSFQINYSGTTARAGVQFRF